MGGGDGFSLFGHPYVFIFLFSEKAAGGNDRARCSLWSMKVEVCCGSQHHLVSQEDCVVSQEDCAVSQEELRCLTERLRCITGRLRCITRRTALSHRKIALYHRKIAMYHRSSQSTFRSRQFPVDASQSTKLRVGGRWMHPLHPSQSTKCYAPATFCRLGVCQQKSTDLYQFI